jgi:hypothetical protein
MNEGGCDCQLIKCAECGEEDHKYNHNLCEGKLLCDDCYDDGRDRDDDNMSECEECGERYELGDFNCVESGMKQYCYCDDCFATKIEDGEVIKNPEDEDEWIFKNDE